MANAESAEYDHEDGILPYRGRRYRVPPVPHRIGLRIYCLERLVDWCHRESKKLEKDGKTRSMTPMPAGSITSWWSCFPSSPHSTGVRAPDGTLGPPDLEMAAEPLR
jgi:hypothetical protein